MTIKNVKLSDMEPYKGDNKKSFEHLCYQIVSEEFKDIIKEWAKLTPIDDSGWWSWVEFYIEFENWDVWWWQCKFVDRVSEAKEQIKKSLKKSYDIYKDKLKKWFLCSMNDLTPWENSWYYSDLEKTILWWNSVLPEHHWVKFFHWWDSEISKFLQKYKKIHTFFFGVNNYEIDWFLDKYKIDKERAEIKTKYIQEIHLQTDIDDNLSKTLVNEELIEILEKEIEGSQIRRFNEDYIESINTLQKYDIETEKLTKINIAEKEWRDIKSKMEELLSWKENIVKNSIIILDEIKSLIKQKNENDIRNKITDLNWYIKKIEDFTKTLRNYSDSDFCKWLNYIQRSLNRNTNNSDKSKKKNIFKRLINLFGKDNNKIAYHYSWIDQETLEIDKKNNIIWSLRDKIFWPLNELEEWVISALKRCIRVFELIDLNEHHICGDAGMWKTHVAFNIYEKYLLEKKLPSVLIFAKYLNSESFLITQIEEYLKIDNFWDFIWILDSYGIQNNSKIPFIIDWLNESRYWKVIWQDQLEEIILNIKAKYKHVVFISTYRTSYQDALFPNEYFDYKKYNDVWMKRTILSWFSDLGWESIKKYLNYFKIELTSYSSSAIERFSHPLYLRIFCDIKNNERKSIKKISLQNEDIFEIFDEYIKKANKNITNGLELLNPKYNKHFTYNKLLEIWKYLWDNNTRWIPFNVWILSPQELEIFEWENLLIFRDWNPSWSTEEIQFTYDFLWWYLISKYLLHKYEKWYPIFQSKLFNTIFSFLEKPSYPFVSDKWKDYILNKFHNIRYWNNWYISFIKSREFKIKLLDNNNKHPLYDDILRSLSVLFIKKELIFLFKNRKEKTAIKYWVNALFEINKSHIEDPIIQEWLKSFLYDYFLNNPELIIWYSRKNKFDIDHPFNFEFFHEILNNFTLPFRDYFWTTEISYYKEDNIIRQIELLENKIPEIQKKSDDEKLYLIGLFYSWFLSSTNNYIRNKVTKLLVQIFTDKPKIFSKILHNFHNVNDPYIYQRLISVAWWIVSRSSKSDDIKYFISSIYKYFYIENNIPIDILSRDYIKLICEYGVFKLNMDLDLKITKYPYVSKLEISKIPTFEHLKRISDKNYIWKNKYRDYIWYSVMHSQWELADFWNYTLWSKVSHWSSIKIGEPKIPTQKEIEDALKNSIWEEMFLEMQKIEEEEHINSVFSLMIGDKKIETWDVKKDLKAKEKKNKFINKLSSEQKKYYDTYIEMQNKVWMFKRPNSFDTKIAERWVYNKTIELGYDKDLHSDFDSLVWRSSYSRQRWKIERIGKKYQWIAMYELLARISDNYKFLDDSWSKEEAEFISPQIIHIRDIDPTHIPKSHEFWWYDEELENYLFTNISNKDFIKNEKKLWVKDWIESNDWIPEYKDLIERVDENWIEWCLLEGYFSITERDEKNDMSTHKGRQLRNQIRSYIIEKDDTSEMVEWLKEKNFMWRELMPESTDNHYSYIWELYWSEGYNNLYTPYYWYEEWTDNYWKLPKKVIVTAENYLTEREWDDVEWIWKENMILLSKFLWDNLNCEWNDKLEAFINKKWEIIAFNPIIKCVKENSLLIRKDFLLEFLNTNNLSIIYTVLWEKLDFSLLDVRNTINGVYYFNNDKLEWWFRTVKDKE